MRNLWIAKAQVDGKTVYLTDYVGVNRSEVLAKVWNRALNEGYTGTAEERLKELGWQVIQVGILERRK